MSVLLAFCVEKLRCHWTDFHEVSYLSTFRKSVQKIQVSLETDRNNGYFRGNVPNIVPFF
jgi:hypothetical protein